MNVLAVAGPPHSGVGALAQHLLKWDRFDLPGRARDWCLLLADFSWRWLAPGNHEAILKEFPQAKTIIMMEHPLKIISKIEEDVSKGRIKLKGDIAERIDIYLTEDSPLMVAIEGTLRLKDECLLLKREDLAYPETWFNIQKWSGSWDDNARLFTSPKLKSIEDINLPLELLEDIAESCAEYIQLYNSLCPTN